MFDARVRKHYSYNYTLYCEWMFMLVNSNYIYEWFEMSVECYITIIADWRAPVSYTHLDVYKRQVMGWLFILLLLYFFGYSVVKFSFLELIFCVGGKLNHIILSRRWPLEHHCVWCGFCLLYTSHKFKWTIFTSY